MSTITKLENRANALADIDRDRARLVDERDQLIVHAKEMGFTITHIAQAAGISRARVYGVLEAHTTL